MTIRLIFLCVATLIASGAAAQDSGFEKLGRSAGLIAPPTDPPDFVKASRASAPTETIPAFAPPPEPHSKVKTDAELGAMDTDLQRASGATGTAPKKKRKAAHP